MRGRRLTASLGVAIGLVAGTAAADPGPSVSTLGAGRAISRAWSASRDAPAFALALAPRGIRTAAAELSLVTIATGAVTARASFYGLLELEGKSDEASFSLWPSQEIHFWRGAFGFEGAFALEALARRACGSCVLEATVMFRHESEHYTGSNDGGDAIDYGGSPIYGDAIVTDVAGAFRAGSFVIQARLAAELFIPGRSSYRVGPALDLHVRHVGSRTVQPFVSGYAEYHVGDDLDTFDYPDAYLLRALVGVAFRSDLGAVMLYLSGDVGHRKGLAAYREEATFGAGVRLAIDPRPNRGD